MKTSKLVQLLSTLKEEEVKAFGKYLNKLYRDHDLAVKLFEHLRKFHPDYDHPKMAKDYIINKVIKDPVVNEKRVGNEASKLFGWLEDYLLIERLNSSPDKFDKQRLLVYLFKERGAENLFNKKLEACKKSLITNGGYITEQRFHSIVNSACELGEFEWLESFIAENNDLLTNYLNCSAIQLANARILLEKNSFDKELDDLSGYNKVLNDNEQQLDHCLEI